MKQIVAMRDDIAFYVKLFPLTTIHPEAYGKSAAVLCEEDNAKALQLLDDIFAKKPIPAAKCKTTAVDDTIRVGRGLGVSSTPTLIFQSGKVVSGALKSNDIVARATEKQTLK